QRAPHTKMLTLPLTDAVFGFLAVARRARRAFSSFSSLYRLVRSQLWISSGSTDCLPHHSQFLVSFTELDRRFSVSSGRTPRFCDVFEFFRSNARSSAFARRR